MKVITQTSDKGRYSCVCFGNFSDIRNLSESTAPKRLSKETLIKYRNIKPIIESCCGYDLIIGEDLTKMERNMRVIGALVDLTTGIYDRGLLRLADGSDDAVKPGNRIDGGLGQPVVSAEKTELHAYAVNNICGSRFLCLHNQPCCLRFREVRIK